MDFGLKDVQSHSDASTPTASSAIFVLQYVSLYSFLQQQDFNLSEEEKKIKEMAHPFKPETNRRVNEMYTVL